MKQKVIVVIVVIFTLAMLFLLYIVKNMKNSTDIRRYTPVFDNGVDTQLIEAEDGIYLSVKKKTPQRTPTILQAHSLNPIPATEVLNLQLVNESDIFATYQIIQPVQKSGINPDCIGVYDGKTLLKYEHISLSFGPRLGEKWMCSSIDFENLRSEY